MGGDQAMEAIHNPVHVRFPNMIELMCYCPAELVTPDYVTEMVRVLEGVIEEPIDHVARNVFPQPIKRSIQYETELAWKAGRSPGLCNKLTSKNHIQIHARRAPRLASPGVRKHYGHVQVLLRETAPACQRLSAALEDVVTISKAIHARVDSPAWWTSRPPGQRNSLRVLRIADDWKIAERLGWRNYWPKIAYEGLEPHVTHGFGGSFQESAHGAFITLSAQPFDFSRPEHVHAHQVVEERLLPA